MPEQTVEQKIETMLQDTVKGLATKDELQKSVAELVQKEFERQEHEKAPALTEAQKTIKELQQLTQDMAKQIKTLMRTNFAPIKTSDGRYRGVWPSLEMAKNFGLFILSDISKHPEARKQFDALGIERQWIVGDKIVKGYDDEFTKAMAAGDITTGGLLAPNEFIPQLVMLLEEHGLFRQLAQEWPVGSNSASYPIVTSGLTVYCPGAGVAPTASDPGFRMGGLTPLEWLTYTALDKNLDEDAAIAVGEVIGRLIVVALAEMEDKCGFVGDGTSTYFNIFGARAALRDVDATVTNVAGLHVQDTAGAWSSIDLQDILAVAGLLPVYADKPDVAWVSSKPFYMTVMVNAALSAGGAFAAEVTHTAYTQNPQFLGRRVGLTSTMPTAKEAADHCPLLFGNFKQGAALGDRRKIGIDKSDQVKFLERQICILGSERIDISITGVGDTNNAGPIVGLWADIA